MPNWTVGIVALSLFMPHVVAAAVIGLDDRSRVGTALSLGSGEAYEELRGRLASLGHTSAPLNSFEAADLDDIDALFLINPLRASERFSGSEISAIHDAIGHRMGLVVLGEVAHQDENNAVVSNLNALSSSFGVEYSRFINDHIIPPTNIFVPHPVTTLLGSLPNPSVAIYLQRRLVRIDPPAVDLTVGSEERYDFLATVDGLPCAGNIVFLSDSSLWWDPDYLLNVGLDQQANRQLMDNVIGFVTQRLDSFDDCNKNGFPDSCDFRDGRSSDCNKNDIPDECDIREGSSLDFNDNFVPDECDPDCQPNGIPDFLDLVVRNSEDCNDDQIPDECQPIEDFDKDGLLDICDHDVDNDGVENDLDVCDFTPAPAAVDAEGRPRGDLDGDCDTDLFDWAQLQQGFTGPN